MSNKLLNLLIFRSLHTSGSTTLSAPTPIVTGLLLLLDWLLHMDFEIVQISNITYPFPFRISPSTDNTAQLIADRSEDTTASALLGLIPCCRLRLVGIIPSASYAFEGAADFVHDDGGSAVLWLMESVNVLNIAIIASKFPGDKMWK